MGFSEADMSAPISDYLLKLGYNVRSEVKGCDIMAERGEELVVIELKKNFSLRLIYQALERFKLTDQVYVAIPRPKKKTASEYTGMLKLLKRLELGLITVAMDSPVHSVELLLYPEAQTRPVKNPARRKSALKELHGRLMDLNTAGSRRTKIITAYRERCIKIACILKCRGPKKISELVADYGCERDAGAILRGNYDQWFKRISRGVYELSETGHNYLETPNALAQYYIKLYGGVNGSI